jgi:site-specific DNA-methyltransferase (adenine-specific)
MSKSTMIELLNIDCLEYMKGLPDKAFQLAIVDPPYGIGFGEFNRTNIASNGMRVKANKYKNGQWDAEIPTPEYFSELIRCSKQQIIWGGNYFPVLWERGCKGFIYWHKGNLVPNFGDGELAWTSFNKPCKQFDYRYYGNLEGKTTASDKIHPTQKPVALYRWLLHNYATPGDRILDTHLGSGSSAIAAHQMGFDFVGCEINKEYFEAASKRYKEQTAQKQMFQ